MFLLMILVRTRKLTAFLNFGLEFNLSNLVSIFVIFIRTLGKKVVGVKRSQTGT